MIVLVAMIGAVTAHYILADRSRPDKDIGSVVEITGISQPSLSVSWYEPRMIRGIYPAQNPAYPELDPIDRSDFVYEK
jgi:hypothetical protein